MKRVLYIVLMVIFGMVFVSCGDTPINSTMEKSENAERIIPVWEQEKAAIPSGYKWNYALSIKKERTQDELQTVKKIAEEFEESVGSKITNQDISEERIPVYEEEALLFRDDISLSLCGSTRIVPSMSRYDYSGKSFLCVRFPTNALRIRDSSTVYGMYRTNTGFRYYVFFDRVTGLFIGYPILIDRMHSSKEFEYLAIGDDIQKVEAIDRVTSLYKKSALEQDALGMCRLGIQSLTEEEFSQLGIDPPENEKPMTAETLKSGYDPEKSSYCILVVLTKERAFISLHYLTDGLMRIEYEISETDTIKITDISLYNDFRIEMNGVMYDEHLLVEDCPVGK